MPLAAGSVHVTFALVLAGVATTSVGAPGTADGTTALDGLDGCPGPVPLRAVTVNEYVSPSSRPVIMQDVVPPGTVHVLDVWELVTR